jgi:hypothetical protein
LAANRAENQLERPMSPRSKEAEVLNCVPVALKNMLSPEINELLHCMADRHDFISALVFGPERNRSFIQVGDAALRDSWAASISAGIFKKMCNRVK